AARRSIVGDGTPPPKVLNWPKPTSSSRIRRMFGAPCGACTGWGNCAGSESRYVRPISPGKWKSGRGRMLGVPEAVFDPLGFASIFASYQSACENRGAGMARPPPLGPDTTEGRRAGRAAARRPSIRPRSGGALHRGSGGGSGRHLVLKLARL